ncbi:heme exporter protein CcmD [Marilutibacter alkalisoli]|uniref:Heme exporter protein D n=1 Tax=Marilutibacter alkalisoli TaxID=2591633 RepID=A0A514BR70_9GAMM|nr:heme exporter protein CcmD [Lysobacter alkalisoli]QDH69877.1 heme exporter protein CcmD [Lysobacter alkalisoli]
MSYLGYVVAAYAVFVLVMVWDWLSPQLQLRRELRRVRLRAARRTAHAQREASRAPSEELTR